MNIQSLYVLFMTLPFLLIFGRHFLQQFQQWYCNITTSTTIHSIVYSRKCPGTTCNSFPTTLTMPNAHALSLHPLLRAHILNTTLYSATGTFPQKKQMYFECWLISIFFTIFLSDDPYRVPYLPTTPTFLVRLA